VLEDQREVLKSVYIFFSLLNDRTFLDGSHLPIFDFDIGPLLIVCVVDCTGGLQGKEKSIFCDVAKSLLQTCRESNLRGVLFRQATDRMLIFGEILPILSGSILTEEKGLVWEQDDY
jgi:hypothetical protein